MSEKKKSKKKNDFDDSVTVKWNQLQNPVENPVANSAENLGRKFGAISFVEDIVEDDEDADILSLDSLRDAFAALSDAEEPVEPVYDEEDFTDEPEEPEEYLEPQIESEIEDAASVELNPRTILEAMLFVGDRNNRPLNPAHAAEKMRNVTPGEIDRVVVELNRDYGNLGCPYTIIRETDGYRMILRAEFEPILTKFYGKIREARLSQQAIDTLAVVAYQQPITAEEVQKLRRQPSSSLLNQLVRRGLLETDHQVREKKKITFFKTTDRFLELFQLESIDDLPISEEIDFR